MKLQTQIILLITAIALLASCAEKKETGTWKHVDWESKAIQLVYTDSLETGSTYLSVYSEIYSLSQKTTHDLTVTVSIRNVSSTDSVFIEKAEYYNTAGDLIRSYLDETILVKPMETIEIVVESKDRHGGSGANFIFDWAVRKNAHEPLFEAVMISTSGQQGISFTTQGVRR